MKKEKYERKGMYMKEVYNVVKKETVDPRNHRLNGKNKQKKTRVYDEEVRYKKEKEEKT